MKLAATNLNLLWTTLLFEELSRLGVRLVVVSPGSRSAPLAIAAATCDRLRKVVHFDERGAAYYALGCARATGKPVVLVCTSGTAAANYLPAVIEASQDRIPLIVLTADRPPELRDSGANQTITQPGIFGSYVRWQFDMPCPTIEIDPAMVLTTVDQAVYRAGAAPEGPVHINCMFREPLAPTNETSKLEGYLSALSSWRMADTPYTTYSRVPANSVEIESEIGRTLAATKRGLVIVGRLTSQTDVAAVQSLTTHLGWPVIPDILSQLRLGEIGSCFMPYADLVLSADATAQDWTPETILYLGDQVVSKRLQNLCTRAHVKTVIHVTNHPYRHDAAHRVTYRLDGPVGAVCKALERLTISSDTTYLNGWQAANQRVGDVLKRSFSDDKLSEPAIANRLSQLIDPHHALFLASSLAIRNFDTYAACGGSSVQVAANRGASGIDGTIASAIGFANGIGMPLTLVIGDLAMLHDLNSLALLTHSKQPITVVLLNNDGGAIFGMLPVAEVFAEYEQYFVAPHGMSFASIATQFKMLYARPDSRREFEEIYSRSAGNHHALIEVTIDRKTDRNIRRALVDSAASALKLS